MKLRVILRLIFIESVQKAFLKFIFTLYLFLIVFLTLYGCECTEALRSIYLGYCIYIFFNQKVLKINTGKADDSASNTNKRQIKIYLPIQ